MTGLNTLFKLICALSLRYSCSRLVRRELWQARTEVLG